jgi:glycosyltransferase involved in cell wall biosynthesis
MKNKMSASNLLIITTYFPHQRNLMSGLFVKRQVDELKKNFNKVYVLAINPNIPPPLSKLKFVPQGTKDIYYAKDYSYDNVSVFFIKALPIFYNSYYAKLLYKKSLALIKKNKINFSIIHAHFSWPSGFVAAKLKKYFQKPMLITIHENRDWFIKEINSNRRMLIQAWKSADKLIRVNKKDLQFFSKFNIDKLKLISIPNGYPNEIFRAMNKNQCRNELNLDENKIILLNIGNLETNKGQEYLIKALKKVKEKHSNLLLYIIGIGSLRNHLLKLIKNNKLNNYVKMVGGNKPSNEMPKWYNSCDLFIIPSLSEGNPTVMFEALGCGKPIVATKVGGIPEIIINNNLGLLVEPRNIDQLSESIIQAIEKKWNSNFILDYAKQFTWNEIANQILKLYNELIA